MTLLIVAVMLRDTCEANWENLPLWWKFKIFTLNIFLKALNLLFPELFFNFSLWYVHPMIKVNKKKRKHDNLKTIFWFLQNCPVWYVHMVGFPDHITYVGKSHHCVVWVKVLFSCEIFLWKASQMKEEPP